MSKKTSKWSVQELKLLKQLREDQINRNQVNWEIIAFILNQKFPNSMRTSKQCRQKYVNHARLYQDKISSEWSKEQYKTLFILYKKFGPCWSFFSTKLINRSQNNIKNKFNNSLRKASKILSHREGQIYKHTKKSITTQMLVSMMEFVNQIQKSINKNGFTINQKSKFLDFRYQILKLCQQRQIFSSQDVTRLVKLIKTLNCKIRSFGIFKPRKKRNWSLTREGLLSILQFDNVINQQVSIPQGNLTIEEKQTEGQKKNTSISPFSTLNNIQFPQTLVLQQINLQDFINDVSSLRQFDEFDKQVNQILGQQNQFRQADISLIF